MFSVDENYLNLLKIPIKYSCKVDEMLNEIAKYLNKPVDEI